MGSSGGKGRWVWWAWTAGLSAAVAFLWSARPVPSVAARDLLYPEKEVLQRKVDALYEDASLNDLLDGLGKQAHCRVASTFTALGRDHFAGVVSVHAKGLTLGEAIDLVAGEVYREWPDEQIKNWRESGWIYVGPVEDFCPAPAVTLVYWISENTSYLVDETNAGKLRDWVEGRLARAGGKDVKVWVVRKKVYVRAEPGVQKYVAEMIKSWPGQ